MKTYKYKNLKVAAIEFNPTILQLDENIKAITKLVEEAAIAGAKLIALPEEATSLIFDTRPKIDIFLDTIPGKATDAFASIAKKYDCYIVVGMAEIDPDTDVAYNSAAIIWPTGYIGKYRKNQLNAFDNMWAARGNLGFPVFETPIGNIGVIICYDDTNLQSLLLPNLRGADIIVFCTSASMLLSSEEGHKTNHSTIATITTMSGWLGTYILACNSVGNEISPIGDLVVHQSGASSVWDPYGKPIAITGTPTWLEKEKNSILYADIDTKNFKNSTKDHWLNTRRPELYKYYYSYRPVNDSNVALRRNVINSLLIQYEPIEGDKDKNFEKIKKMIYSSSGFFNLVVLPFNSLIGTDVGKHNVKNYAEQILGYSVEKIKKLAADTKAFYLFSMPEIDNGKYYQTAILIDPQGKIIQTYRKTHLNEEEKTWATAGTELPIASTSLGNIAIILDDECRIPELSELYGIKRADLILIPTSFDGSYGGPILTPRGILVSSYPKKSMYIWYNIAKYAQAHVLVSNFIGGKKNNTGSSGLYYLTPEMGFYPPNIATDNKEEALETAFYTMSDSMNWISQQELVVTRRADLALPLMMPKDSNGFIQWISDKTSSI